MFRDTVKRKGKESTKKMSIHKACPHGRRIRIRILGFVFVARFVTVWMWKTNTNPNVRIRRDESELQIRHDGSGNGSGGPWKVLPSVNDTQTNDMENSSSLPNKSLKRRSLKKETVELQCNYKEGKFSSYLYFHLLSFRNQRECDESVRCLLDDENDEDNRYSPSPTTKQREKRFNASTEDGALMI